MLRRTKEDGTPVYIAGDGKFDSQGDIRSHYFGEQKLMIYFRFQGQILSVLHYELGNKGNYKCSRCCEV